MKIHQSSYAFFEKLIDYAGLFPPANLSLSEAIKNYADYMNSEDAWMLGPFVLPVKKLEEVQAYQDFFIKKKPLSLSIVSRKVETEKEFIVSLKEDIAQMYSFLKKNKQWSKIEAIEVCLPPTVPTFQLLEEISKEADKLGVRTFCEVSLPESAEWRNKLTLTLERIADFNSSQKDPVGIKLRTGGIKAEMFPSPEKLAFALAYCRDRNLALKFTAGLHHPIRMFRDEVNTKMHGFVNLFLAGLLACTKNLDEKIMIEIISDEKRSNFSVSPECLSWQNLSISYQAIKKLRTSSLCSFGSCSFVEPRDEFWELSNQKEVIK
jgi:hypothetical protein